MAELFFGGGAGEIGGPNFIVLETDSGDIAVDCGIGFRYENGKEVSATPDFSAIRRHLSATLITHGHLDHVGASPLLRKVPIKKDFRIYMSEPTRDFARMQWKETTEKKGKAPLFSKKDVKKMPKIKIIDSGYQFKINNDIHVRAFSVAHILGALGYLVEFKEKDGTKKRIFFTGDFSFFQYPYIDNFDSRIFNYQIDTLVTEGTYLGKQSPDFNSELKRFETDINSFIAEKRKILIPVFSIDRAQKIFWILRNIPGVEKYVYIDGAAAIYVTGLYNKYNKGKMGNAQNYFTNKASLLSKLQQFNNGPNIILATSGMMIKGTLSYNYAQEWIDEDDAAILFVGYQSELNLGKAIISASENKLAKFSHAGKDYDLKAEIRSYNFTAHANEKDISSLISRLGAKNVVFVHGEEDKIKDFIQRDGTKGNISVPKNGERVNF